MKRSHLSAIMLGLTACSVLTSRRPGDGEVQLQVSYPTIAEIPEAFRPLYKEVDGKAVLSGVVGLKTQDDINRLQGALDKERNDHRTVKTSLARFGERSVDDVLGLLDKIPALELAAKGGTDVEAQLASRLEQHTAPLKRTLEQSTATITELQGQVKQYQQRENDRAVTDNVVNFAAKSKALPEAVEDIAFMARAIFERNEAGEVVAKAGIPGVTPGISPEVWLTELKRSKPFYWPASAGAGAGGGQGGQGGSNPWHKDSWNMTEQGKVLRENRTKADQLAAQAGTSVGGPRPK